MRDATLCFIVDSNKILLGMKKIGFGKGKYNGFGGKRKENETVEQAAIRELKEESGIIANGIEKVAKLHFSFPVKKDWNQTVHVYIIKEWQGEPEESNEMKPQWFNINSIPFHSMWSDDKHWLPLVLQGRKIEAHFHFKKDNEDIHKYDIKEHPFL